jgi:multiple sugar transport system substrate-binding protein
MTRALVALVLLATLASCGVRQAPNEIVVQRFFGTCRAEYGDRTDVEQAEGECGIMTTLINRFAAENPDVRVRVSPVAWPGYNQLSAQIAAGDPPDLVTMHFSAIPDYESRKLLEPMGDALRAAGVNPDDFTTASLAGVSKHGEVYGMPIDNWAPLWHINMNYFRQAGLVKDGKPILPRNPAELLEHARQFTKATGKPYLVQALANQTAAYTRNFYTLMMQQNSQLFADPQRIKLQSPEAKRVFELFQQIYAEDLTTKNLDYASATNAFINGAGGVYLVGTWLISDFDAQARQPNRPLSGGYAVMPFPQLYQRDATYIDGHAWVMPTKDRTPQQRDALFRLLKFLADNDYHWARTGHVPSFKPVIESERFNALPHRSDLAKLSLIGTPLPSAVQRQFPVQDIIGEEMAAAVAGHKPIDAALADAEHRVNELLFHLL